MQIEIKNNIPYAEHKEEGLLLKASYGKYQEGLLKAGVPLSYFAGQVSMNINTRYNFENDYLNELSAEMIDTCRNQLLALVGEGEIAELIKIKQKDIEKEAKKILAEIQERNFIKEMMEMSGEELAKTIKSFEVFGASYNNYTGEINVYTDKTLSKASWNRCRALNGGKYLSNVDFNIKANVKEVYEVIDISRKTCKFSQEQLQKMKKERLSRKHSPATSSKQSFSDWYNNADMPHKIDGRWVDLETGFTYQ